VSYVGLESLKALNTIMKSSICWIEFKRSVCANNRILPATIMKVIINLQHVVSSNSAKGILVLWAGLWLQIIARDKLKVPFLNFN